MLKISFKFAEAMGDTEIGKIERKKRSFLYYYPTSTTNNGFTSNEAGWAVQFRSTNGYLVLNKIIPNTIFLWINRKNGEREKDKWKEIVMFTTHHEQQQ